ncbi:MAG: 2'-5' RNA ligase family protein [Pseudobdellovibrionaceae bacterium]
MLNVMLTSCATQAPQASRTPQTTQINSDPSLFPKPLTNEKAEFIAHTEKKPMQAYLAMNLPYTPYQAILEQLQKLEGISLVSRGEAHITVITPIEYNRILKKHLKIDEIHKIAEAEKIQETPFTPVCIGKVQKELKGKMEKAYFVVVESPALIELRGKIEEAYVNNGGRPQEFIPERFMPHVTLGFTARDLHLEDGVFKNNTSCLYQFQP